MIAERKKKRFAPDGIPGAHAGRIVTARPRWELAKPMNVADGLVHRIRKARSASGLRLDSELRPAQIRVTKRGSRHQTRLVDHERD